MNKYENKYDNEFNIKINKTNFNKAYNQESDLYFQIKLIENTCLKKCELNENCLKNCFNKLENINKYIN